MIASSRHFNILLKKHKNKIPGVNFENKPQTILIQVRKVRNIGKGSEVFKDTSGYLKFF